MSAETLLCLSLPIGLIACVVLGDFVGRRRRASASWFVVAMTVPLLAKALSRHFQATEVAWFGIDLYPVLRPWWALPFAFGLLSCAGATRTRSTERRGLRVLLACLSLFVLQRLHATVTSDPSGLQGRVDSQGVCLQTSPVSCGAAAAAMLLHQVGISRTESEMARLCSTNSLTGTDDFCVQRGIDRVLRSESERGRGLAVHYSEPAIERLEAPAMVPIRLSFLIDHWVVLESVDRERGTATVLDPIDGRSQWTLTEFGERWRERAIRCVPRQD